MPQLPKPGSLTEQIAKYFANPADFPAEFLWWLRQFWDQESSLDGDAIGEIRFNFDNEGGYLNITVNAASTQSGLAGGFNLRDLTTAGINILGKGGAGIVLYAGLQASVTYPGSVGGPNVNPVILASDGGAGAPSVMVGINGTVVNDSFAVYDFKSVNDDVWFKVSNFNTYVRNLTNLDDGLYVNDFSGFGYFVDAYAGGGQTYSTHDGGNFLFKLSGDKFEIRDGSGNPILRVNDDGTLHIKTGSTWVADL